MKQILSSCGTCSNKQGNLCQFALAKRPELSNLPISEVHYLHKICQGKRKWTWGEPATQTLVNGENSKLWHVQIGNPTTLASFEVTLFSALAMGLGRMYKVPKSYSKQDIVWHLECEKDWKGMNMQRTHTPRTPSPVHYYSIKKQLKLLTLALIWS